MTARSTPRLANLMLHEAARIDITITHLTLQKLLYFAHGLSLVRYGQPLVLGYFEAWRLGPVHPWSTRHSNLRAVPRLISKQRHKTSWWVCQVKQSPSPLSPPPKPRG